MEIGRVYQKYADAIKGLAGQVAANDDYTMPIGVDGAVLAYLMEFVNWTFLENSYIRNIVAASSKTGEMDVDRIRSVSNTVFKDHYLMAVDLRTKTGKLNSMLRGAVSAPHFMYCVGFDSGGNCDYVGSNETLEDHEVLRWCEPEIYSKLIYKEDGRWIYDICANKIAKFDHVNEIKKLL